MRRNTSRTLAEIDTFDLTLEKRGRRTDITPERREATAAFAEAEGYDHVARKLRELNARRYGFAEPELAAVPNDGRRPLKAGTDRPILVAVDGGSQRALASEKSPVQTAWAHVLRGARRAVEVPGLSHGDHADLLRVVRAAAAVSAEPLVRPRESPR